MSIKEDRNEFNITGLRGLLRRTMATSSEAFIKIVDGGHRGTVLTTRPARGSGPYLHYKSGEGVFEYRNSSSQDDFRESFRIEV